MSKTGKKYILGGRGKVYYHGGGPQIRFILFLILLLISYTVLLRVFQKLAEFVEFPLFIPISLVTLLLFIGIVGILYSHTFVGPIIRIRNALEQMAEGERNLHLRLRESDDPMLKDLVKTVSRLCANSRNSRVLVQEAAEDLFKDLAALQDSIHGGAEKAQVQKQLDGVREKQELLDKAIKAFSRA
jgi:uncharacterized membrane protein